VLQRRYFLWACFIGSLRFDFSFCSTFLKFMNLYLFAFVPNLENWGLCIKGFFFFFLFKCCLGNSVISLRVLLLLQLR
jgi:hypothetical protein